MKTCDIIIPTYNGEKKLRQHVIPALRGQHIPTGWTVRLVICDDGSQKKYEDTFEWDGSWQAPRILHLTHAGRSQTRNAGIDASTADVLLFLADDIILRQNALASHLQFHEMHTELHTAALGCIVWDPRLEPTAFMEWMMHGGQQNDYDSLLGVATCDAAQFFYGSFISLKRAYLGGQRFNEAMTQYGWEDLELGERLKKKGLTLSVLHDARALHRHLYSPSAILERQRIVGAGAIRVNRTTTRRLRHTLYWWLGGRAVLTAFVKKYGNRHVFPRIFEYVTAGEFWYGVYNQSQMLINGKS